MTTAISQPAGISGALPVEDRTDIERAPLLAREETSVQGNLADRVHQLDDEDQKVFKISYKVNAFLCCGIFFSTLFAFLDGNLELLACWFVFTSTFVIYNCCCCGCIKYQSLKK